MKPRAADLYCGLGGWAEGLIAEGWDVVGFDIERHDYGAGGYPGQLVLMDARHIHGAVFRDFDLIVASPPCQEFSYRAMPWKRAKALPPPLLGTNLFWQCWRIQQEACEAAGRYIPMVVENVKGAQPWIGRARAHFGSFYLWGDVNSVGDAIVGAVPRFGEVVRAGKRGANGKVNPDGTAHPQGSWFKIADSKNRGARADRTAGAHPATGANCSRCTHKWEWHDRQYGCAEEGCSCERFEGDSLCQKQSNGVSTAKHSQQQMSSMNVAEAARRDTTQAMSGMTMKEMGSSQTITDGTKNKGGSWFAFGSPGQTNVGQNPDGRKVPGIKLSDVGFNVAAAQRYREGNKGFAKRFEDTPMARVSSRSNSRKAASAQIAKIPLPLSTFIGRVFHP